jgi:hypothetical protein
MHPLLSPLNEICGLKLINISTRPPVTKKKIVKIKIFYTKLDSIKHSISQLKLTAIFIPDLDIDACSFFIGLIAVGFSSIHPDGPMKGNVSRLQRKNIIDKLLFRCSSVSLRENISRAEPLRH